MTTPPRIPVEQPDAQLQDDLCLFYTQGGGIARLTPDGTYIWHEVPEWMSSLPDGDLDKAQAGDPIPKEWDLIPASVSARAVMLTDEV